ncbi:hypothetical protein P3H15_11315 [Rhodococcus sp. T2V]|uniref:hypothetical protein n=1 Tax=Rhodococcus sp. T2V TaxID=3034164 RepID=UPI0023E2AD6F|nr:hypothetical protein [Rhodococcus sp. T2V]MDF3305609.1 hypothetical protein [Rhodococcus sp. T2V]
MRSGRSRRYARCHEDGCEAKTRAASQRCPRHRGLPAIEVRGGIVRVDTLRLSRAEALALADSIVDAIEAAR